MDLRERLVTVNSEIGDTEQRVRRAKARLEFARKARVEAADKEWQKNESILTGLQESTEEGTVLIRFYTLSSLQVKLVHFFCNFRKC